jgi:two-component system invasion response regulator UvrY
MIRILIADDHLLIREGLKRVIAQCTDLEVVDEANDGEEAILKSKNPAIDVIARDVSIPGPGFLEVLRRVCADLKDAARARLQRELGELLLGGRQ